MEDSDQALYENYLRKLRQLVDELLELRGIVDPVQKQHYFKYVKLKCDQRINQLTNQGFQPFINAATVAGFVNEAIRL